MSQVKRIRFSTGATRDDHVAGQKGKPLRYDLIPAIPLRRIAEIYAEGATKYGPRAWERGIPNDNLLNHSLAHLVAYMNGDRTEDHLPKVAWGLFALMHFEEKPS